MYDVYRLLGIKKINTTAYHLQTDGLVERFNRTLTSILAKTVKTIQQLIVVCLHARFKGMKLHYACSNQ